MRVAGVAECVLLSANVTEKLLKKKGLEYYWQFAFLQCLLCKQS